MIALGGNALLRRGEPMDADNQRRNVEIAAAAIAALDEDYQVVITHGNGPQVGLLALQAEATPDTTPYPLDVLGAESEGMIGYLIEQALGNHLGNRPIATLLTQVVVDADDPAFANPTKPIGPIYDEPPPAGSPTSAAGRWRRTDRASAGSCPHPSPARWSRSTPSGFCWTRG